MRQEKASWFIFVNPSALMHSEGYSSPSVCVCVCVCLYVRFLYSAFSHILVSNER